MNNLINLNIKTEKITKIFKIPVYNLESFYLKFEKLRKKIAKTSEGDITMVIKRPYDTKMKNKDGEEYTLEIYPIEVSGDTFVIEGYNLIAILEKRQAGAIVSFSNPKFSEEILKRTEHSSECQVCGTKRTRKNLIVIEDSSSGEIYTVGKECAKDMFLKNMVGRYLFMSTLLELTQEEETEFRGTGLKEFYPIESFLVYSIAFIRSEGYIGVNSPGSTVEKVKSNFNKPTLDKAQSDEELARGFLDNPDPYFEKVSKNNFYTSLKQNIKTLIAENMVSKKDLWIVCMAAKLLVADITKTEAMEDTNNNDSKGFLGELNTKISTTITITERKISASSYHRGDDYHISAIGPNGEILQIPGTNFWPEVGETIKVSGTVKGHYKTKRGMEITKLIRVKTIECPKTDLVLKRFVEFIGERKIRTESDYMELVGDICKLDDHISGCYTHWNNYNRFLETGKVFVDGEFVNHKTDYKFKLLEKIEEIMEKRNGYFCFSLKLI